MDINFPLILVVLVFVSGLIWLLDALLLAPRRREAIGELRNQLPAWSEQGSQDASAYSQAEPGLAREPVLVEYSKSFFPVLFIVLVLRSFLVEPFQIPSSSMVPTLEVGDYILVNKFAYGIRLPVLRTKVIDVDDPQRGDVMVFFPPNDSRYFIKRVIGLPGDQISYKNKELFVNGESASQQLLAALPPGNPQYQLLKENLAGVEHQLHHAMGVYGSRPIARDFSVTVKPGHYFMMGDNRDNSSDSRVWGQVPEANIVGKAFATWMHWENFFSLPSFSRAGAIQ
jgi:signal peptidase I